MQQRSYTLLSLYTATLFNSILLVNFSVFGDNPDNLEKVGQETCDFYIDKERYYFILTHSFRQKQLPITKDPKGNRYAANEVKPRKTIRTET